MKDSTRRMTYAAICLALALILPLITGQIPSVGASLCPMHLPVLLCGYLCGPLYGLIVGLIAPIVRFLIFGMPPLFPTGVAMAVELAAYGALTGLFYKLFPKKTGWLFFGLILAMIGGRVLWGLTRFAIAGLSGSAFSLQMFLAGAVTNAIPGIIAQLVLVPIIVTGVTPKKA